MQKLFRRSLVALLKRAQLLDSARRIRDRARRHTRGAREQTRRMREFYSDFIRPGALCIDVGANVGNRTEVFLELGARVVAVEPQPDCVRKLTKRFGKHPGFTLVRMALGESEGEGDLQVSDSDTLSSMSSDWIQSVRRTGRFGDSKWGTTIRVPMTTLEALIRVHGVPDFCKIDVEGYEAAVLRGLTRRIAGLSFEFTPEFLNPTLDSVLYLSGLGFSRFNYSVGESMRLELRDWLGPDAMVQELLRLPDQRVFGDVYAR